MPATVTTQLFARGGHAGYVLAWGFCLLFYFGQYALRSAPSVMVPELETTFGLSALGVSSLVGLYYYTYSSFAIIAGVALLVIAFVVLIATPSGHDARPVGGAPLLSMFKPYKTVLANPQSWLCGLTSALLFLPTTIGDMIWGVPFLRDGLGVSYPQAVDRASMVPLGWVIGAPLLGFVADRIGRRKPVLIGGALLMLVASVVVVYLPGTMPPYILGLLLGIGSGAAMIPYTVIKEVNPDNVKGSATGAINFVVFAISALIAPAYGWLLTDLSAGGKLTLNVFQDASWAGIAGTVLAIVLACFLRETGRAGRPAAPSILMAKALT
jgi:hypothetical protein